MVWPSGRGGAPRAPPPSMMKFWWTRPCAVIGSAWEQCLYHGLKMSFWYTSCHPLDLTVLLISQCSSSLGSDDTAVSFRAEHSSIIILWACPVMCFCMNCRRLHWERSLMKTGDSANLQCQTRVEALKFLILSFKTTKDSVLSVHNW